MGAVFVAFQFLFIAYLISTPLPRNMHPSIALASFDLKQVDKPSEIKKRIHRTKPEYKPKPQQLAIKSEVIRQKIDTNSTKLAFSPIQVDLVGGRITGPSEWSAKLQESPSSNQELLPLLRFDPSYPRKAAIKGIEGYVKLKFSVNEQGYVENIEVLEEKPRRTFAKSAVRALKKWRYKPQVVNGKPQMVEGLIVTLEFKLRH